MNKRNKNYDSFWVLTADGWKDLDDQKTAENYSSRGFKVEKRRAQFSADSYRGTVVFDINGK